MPAAEMTSVPRRAAARWPRSLAVGLAVAFSLVAASSASASSIFFLRASNIWVANPDGSGAKQVTTDGASNPYIFIRSAQQGPAPLLVFHRAGVNAVGNDNNVYGTIAPDGTAATVNPANPQMGSDSGSPLDVDIDAAGDRVAWTSAYYTGSPGSGTHYDADSVGLDGSALDVASASTAIDVTFGDTAGHTLLYADDIDNDYSSTDPTACKSVSYGLALVVPVAYPPMSAPNPQSYYCAAGGLNLLQPALSPNGQLIAAAATTNLGTVPLSIVTVPIGGVASGAAASPDTAVSPVGVDAEHPVFSPDGSQIAFQGANSTVDTVPVGGGTPTQILTDAAVPAWSPYTLPGAAPGPSPGPTPGPSSGKATAKPRALAFKEHCSRVHGKRHCTEPAPLRHRTYRGKASQGQKVTLATDAKGHHVTFKLTALGYTCGDGHTGVENVQVVAHNHVAVAHNGTFAFKIAYRSSGGLTKDVAYAVGSFDGHKAKGIVVGNTQLAGHGECTSGAVTWTATA